MSEHIQPSTGLASGTLVLAERGLVPIDAIAAGDRVLTHLGRYQPVSKVQRALTETLRLSGQGLTRGLELAAGTQIWCCDTVAAARGIDAISWSNAADVPTDGSVRWATPLAFPAAVPPAIGGRRPVHVDDVRFAWLVGRWLGDGSLRVREGNSCEVFVTCGKHEAQELETRLTWVHHDCPTCAPELTWSKRELRTGFVYGNSHSEFARWMIDHFGHRAHGKTVPAWALGAPADWRRALLDGYVSADGHDNGNGIQAATVSKGIGVGVRLLAESLGYRVGLTYSHRDTWRIEGRSGYARPQWSMQWLHVLKKSTAQTATATHTHSWAPIKALTVENPLTAVHSLTVAEDRSFVADGIVVRC